MQHHRTVEIEDMANMYRNAIKTLSTRLVGRWLSALDPELVEDAVSGLLMLVQEPLVGLGVVVRLVDVNNLHVEFNADTACIYRALLPVLEDAARDDLQTTLKRGKSGESFRSLHLMRWADEAWAKRMARKDARQEKKAEREAEQVLTLREQIRAELLAEMAEDEG